MRIIAGELKGRRLNTPSDETIRPTSDKVKGSIFNILQGEMPDAVVIDLFCGSGNLGLEALSRGAKHCYFCDNSKASMELTRENVSACRMADRATLRITDFRRAISSIHDKADIIFLDPPYKDGLMLECFSKLKDSAIMKEDTIIVAEHDKYEDLPGEICGFKKIKEKRFGIIVISIYTA